MAIWHDPLADTYEKPISDYAAGLGEYLDAVADEAWANNPLPSAFRLYRRREAEFGPLGAMSRLLGAVYPGGRENIERGFRALGAPDAAFAPRSKLLSKADANERGKDIGLAFDRDTPEEIVDLLMRRRREKLAAELVFKRSRLDEDRSGRALLSVLTEFAVSAADPLNVASAFLPVVGPARMAAWSARLGRGGAALGRGAIEGAVGAALVEPIVAANALEEDPDYTLGMSVANIAFGTALGGGLHWLGSRLRPARRSDPGPAPAAAPRDTPPADPGEAPRLPPSGDEPDVAQRTAEAVEALPREQREAMQRAGAAQLLQDRRIDVADLAPGVEQRLREEFAADSVGAARRKPPAVLEITLDALARAAARLGDLLQRALEGGAGRETLGAITPDAAAWVNAELRKVKGPFGADVDVAGFRHVVDAEALRHAWERHGPGAPAANRRPDEVPLSAEDLKRIADVIADPDTLGAQRGRGKRSAATLLATKRFDDGTLLVVEQVMTSAREIRFVTAYKLGRGGAGGSGGTMPRSPSPGDTAPQPVRPHSPPEGQQPVSNEARPERASTGAGDNIGVSPDPAKLEAWAERQQAPESDLHADFAAAERVEAAAAEARAARTPEQDLADLEQSWGKALGDEDRAAMKGDVAAVRDPELLEAARVVKALDDEGKAIEALAVCQAGGKPDGV